MAFAVVAAVLFSVLFCTQAFRAMLPSIRAAQSGATATALHSSASHWQRRAGQVPMSASASPLTDGAEPIQWEWAGFAQLPKHIVREATWYDRERTLPALFEDVPEGGIVWMSFANAASLSPSRRGPTAACAACTAPAAHPGLHAPAARPYKRRPSRRWRTTGRRTCTCCGRRSSWCSPRSTARCRHGLRRHCPATALQPHVPRLQPHAARLRPCTIQVQLQRHRLPFFSFNAAGTTSADLRSNVTEFRRMGALKGEAPPR